MVRQNNRQNVDSHGEKSLEEFSFQQPKDGATEWVDEMFLSFVDRVEIWIRPKMSWDERDHYDCVYWVW